MPISQDRYALDRLRRKLQAEFEPLVRAKTPLGAEEISVRFVSTGEAMTMMHIMVYPILDTVAGRLRLKKELDGFCCDMTGAVYRKVGKHYWLIGDGDDSRAVEWMPEQGAFRIWLRTWYATRDPMKED